MILVVNPNPALDRVSVVRFRERSTLRPIRFSLWPGGSGTHAGHVAHLLGAEVVVQAFAGGHTGELFREQVERAGLRAELTPIAAETRETYSLLDVDRGNICDIAERGADVTAADAQAFEARALARIADAELMIISGTVPPGCSPEVPVRLIAAARAAGVPCIADLAGDLLLSAIPARPWLIKPSRPEVADILGKGEVELANALQLARTWLAEGVDNVCISLDASGLLWVSSGEVVQLIPPSVPVFNTIGSGDTLVGAMAATYARTHDLEASLRAGVAGAAANLSYDAPGYCTPADVERLSGQVRVTRLDLESTDAPR